YPTTTRPPRSSCSDPAVRVPIVNSMTVDMGEAERITCTVKTHQSGVHAVRFLALCLSVAVFGITSAHADVLQFSAITDTGEIASLTLDTAIPNTYDPVLYPNLPIRGVYLSSVHDLNFENTHITVADVTTGPGMTGDGRPLTIMDVGPLFDLAS